MTRKPGLLATVVAHLVDLVRTLSASVVVSLRTPVIWQIATRNLISNRRRTLLLGGAIATVTMVLVLLSSVSNGMQVNMLKIATTLSSGHVNVGGFYKMTSGDATPMLSDYPALKKHLDDNKEKLGITHITVRGRGWGKVISDTASQQGALVGIDIANEPTLREVVEIVKGDLSQMSKPNALFLFEKQAKRLEVTVGDALTVTAPTYRGVNNTVDAEVVAIAKDMGMISSFSLFLSNPCLRSLYQMQTKHAGALHVFIKDPEQAENVAASLRTSLAKEGHRVMDSAGLPFWQKFQSVSREDWTGQKLDISTWTDEMQFMKYVLSTFSVLTAIFVSILLGLIVMGVVNTLYMAIRERTREIGTLRAIGMAREYVLSMFTIEAFILSLAATLVGSAAGAGLCAVLNAAEIPVNKAFEMFLMSDRLQLLVDTQTAVLAIVVIAVVTTLSSLLPSWLAAKKPPVTAIQHV